RPPSRGGTPSAPHRSPGSRTGTLGGDTAPGPPAADRRRAAAEQQDDPERAARPDRRVAPVEAVVGHGDDARRHDRPRAGDGMAARGAEVDRGGGRRAPVAGVGRLPVQDGDRRRRAGGGGGGDRAARSHGGVAGVGRAQVLAERRRGGGERQGGGG